MSTKETSTWTVTLKDPENKEPICSGQVQANSDYWAKRNYFDSLYQSNPNLARTPFSAVLPYLSTKNLGAANLKISEYPPESFFEQIRANHKKSTPGEQILYYPYLLSLIQFVTNESLRIEKIPNECPICKNPTKELVIHHWSPGISNQKFNEGIIEGNYRRMCPSCNSSLNVIFKGNYPTTWEPQYEKLREYLQQSPNPNEGPGWWSLLSEEEWNRIKYIWINTPETILLYYLQSMQININNNIDK